MKTELRRRLHATRDALSIADRQRFSEAITNTLITLDAYRSAATVLAYMSFGSEFMTARFVAHVLGEGKALVLPRIRRADESLALYRVGDLDADLAAGPWGIREPRPDLCPVAELQTVDFVLVPGLGFSAEGDRLGYGRGYYDRLLAARRETTLLAAAAFGVQVLERIETAAHDVPVDLVVTEREVYRRMVR